MRQIEGAYRKARLSDAQKKFSSQILFQADETKFRDFRGNPIVRPAGGAIGVSLCAAHLGAHLL